MFWIIRSNLDSELLVDLRGGHRCPTSSCSIAPLVWRQQRQGWDHLSWVSSAGTSFNTDWGWTVDGNDQPGYMYLLGNDDGVFVTYLTRRRGTEAILPTPAIWELTVYGRQQDFEDSPDGWPQQPTYG